MREYLNKQMDDKTVRKQKDEEVNKVQADIWHKDLENFLRHEREKEKYIQDVNKKHQDILVQQMKEKEKGK